MSIWFEILRTIIPVGVAFVSFGLARYLSKKDYIRTVQKERYLGFYVPFIRILLKMNENIDFSMMDKSERDDIVDIIMGKIQYLGAETSNSFISFLDLYSDFDMYFDKDTDEPGERNKWLDDAFKDFADKALLESTALSKELQLIDIGKTHAKTYYATEGK